MAEWCMAEDCRHRNWRSGSMPTHRRGDDCPADPDNVHVIERPEDYLSAGELALLAEEATPHCATCRCGRVIAYLHTTVEGVVHVLHPSSIEIMVEDAP